MGIKTDSLNHPTASFSSVTGKSSIGRKSPPENIGDEERQDKEPGRNLKEKSEEKTLKDAVCVDLSDAALSEGDIEQDRSSKPFPEEDDGPSIIDTIA